MEVVHDGLLICPRCFKDNVVSPLCAETQAVEKGVCQCPVHGEIPTQEVLQPLGPPQ
jgi:hypothetical protein